MDNPIFTTKINATNAGILRKFNNNWKKVYSERKKQRIKEYTPKEIKRTLETLGKYYNFLL